VNVDAQQSAVSSSIRQRRNETILDVQADTFSDAVIRGIVDDWLVPMIVDDLIQSMALSPR
jgi:hypothetical protein